LSGPHAFTGGITRRRKKEQRMLRDSGEAVVADALTKRYGRTEAVRGVSFAIHAQECYGFLGRNGAGKTTTMKMIYCRTPRTSGSLTVLDLDTDVAPARIKARIGVVTQDNALDQELTVMENLLVYASFFGYSAADAADRARRLIKAMSLEGKERARYKELSGGMRRRLVIARALVNDPEMLVLDEPTTGLDPQARLMVWEKLHELRAQGLTLILTTHYMEEAARLCDRVAVMEEGKIHAEGSPLQLIGRFAAAEVLEVTGLGLDPVADGRLDGIVRRREQHGDVTYLYSDDSRLLLNRLEQIGIEARRHTARPATLEDVFLNITGRGLGE
jgi:lipooligosaccharide transport system ATP-binding protein